MTKQEFIEAILKTAKARASKREINDILDAAFGIAKKSVKKEGRFFYPGFGIFSLKRRSARKGRNPQTGAEIRIKASKTVGFKPSATFKKIL